MILRLVAFSDTGEQINHVHGVSGRVDGLFNVSFANDFPWPAVFIDEGVVVVTRTLCPVN